MNNSKMMVVVLDGRSVFESGFEGECEREAIRIRRETGRMAYVMTKADFLFADFARHVR